jgi:hypothetical protein
MAGAGPVGRLPGNLEKFYPILISSPKFGESRHTNGRSGRTGSTVVIRLNRARRGFVLKQA